MDIQTTFDALTDLVAEVISAGFVSAITEHDTTYQTARNLRDGALVQALLGPTLARLAADIGEDAVRKTAARYAAYLKNPYLGRTPLIDEAENADVSFNVAVKKAQMAPGAVSLFDLTLATLRVGAITQVIGEACIYPPQDPGLSGRTGPRQRRREITAADVPDVVAEILLRPVTTAEDQATIVASLRAIEHSTSGTGSLVTKLIALIDQPEGYGVLNTIAGRIRRARFERGDTDQNVAPTQPILSQVSKPPIPSVSRIGHRDEAGEITAVLARPPSASPTPPEPASNPSAPPTGLRARFEQHGPKGVTGKDRLARSQAKHRERSR